MPSVSRMCHGVLALSAVAATMAAAGNPGSYGVPFGTNCAVNAVVSTIEGSDQWTFDATAKTNETKWVPVCSISVSRQMNSTGWDQVRVSADQDFLNANYSGAYYGCGYAEGFVTYADIINLNASQAVPLSAQAKDWIQQQIHFLRQIQNGATPPAGMRSETVKSIKRFMPWLDGITDGMNAALGRKAWTFYDTMVNNLNPELGDIITAVAPATGMQAVQNKPGQTHCSALVKITEDDIYMAHDTWSSFTDMLRQFKTYDFEATITMSSYPGTVSSVDDWYRTSHNLLVTETTNDQDNQTLTQQYVLPWTTPEFMRVMSANLWTTTNGAEWSQIYLDNNSGTYCNQYMILDMKSVPTPFNGTTATLPNNTFWVLEQLPGPYSVAEDMTWFLNQYRHWPSYNIAYFKQVFDMSLGALAEQVFGPTFNYNKYARAEQFAKYQGGITDLAGMQHMMRYNEWQTDPLSVIPQCDGCAPISSPMLAIASRGDLVPTDATFGNLTNVSHPLIGALVDMFAGNAFGAIDNKISSYKMSYGQVNQTSVIVSGPTWDNSGAKPAFSWSGLAPAYAEGQIHLGQPDKFNFDYQTVITPRTPLNFKGAPVVTCNGLTQDQRKEVALAALGGAVALVIVIIVVLRCIRRRRLAASGDGYNVIQAGSNL